MIITDIPYNCIFGRPDNNMQNYHRLDLNCSSDRKHMEKILHYGVGLHCVFMTKSKMITVIYKAHFKQTSYIIPSKSRIEPIILGKDVHGFWHMLNGIHVFEKEVENTISSDQELRFNVDNDIGYSEFQLSFPTSSIITNIALETSENVEFKYPSKCDLIILGSSVAQDNYSSNHMNICSYLYRKYGLNCSTLAISGYHSFLCDELMQYLSTLTNRLVLMDVLHITESQYLDSIARLNSIQHLIIYKNRKQSNDIINNHICEDDVVRLSGDCMWDSVHINDVGTVEYCQQLKNKCII